MTAIDWSDLISDKCAKNPKELILPALSDQESDFPLRNGSSIQFLITTSNMIDRSKTLHLNGEFYSKMWLTIGTIEMW